MKSEISFEDFTKLDLRVGTILQAELVPKSKKLVKLQVSFGEFERQILAGIAPSWGPEDLLNQQLLFVVNLQPRKIMGLESHGMILAAGEAPNIGMFTPTSLEVLDGMAAG